MVDLLAVEDDVGAQEAVVVEALERDLDEVEVVDLVAAADDLRAVPEPNSLRPVKRNALSPTASSSGPGGRSKAKLRCWNG